MRTLISSIAVGLVLVFAAARPSAAQEPVTLPGAVWALVPPPGFAVATEPSAVFQHPSGAVIVVQDTPKRPVTRADFDVTPEQAADIRVNELTEVTVDGKHGFLAVMHVNSRQATSVVLIVEGEQSNGNIIAAIPDEASEVSLDEMRKAVLSAVERPRTTAERLADLPYRLGELSGMRVLHYLPGGMLVLTEGPLDDPEAASEQSFAMIGTMDAGGATFDPAAELGPVTERVKQEYPDATMLSSEVLELPEGDVAEIRYERTTRTSREIVGGVTWAKPLGDRALVMICQHPRGDQAAFARLQQLRDGVQDK